MNPTEHADTARNWRAAVVPCDRCVTKPKLDGVRRCGQPGRLVRDPWGVTFGLCPEHNEPYGYPLLIDGREGDA